MKVVLHFSKEQWHGVLAWSAASCSGSSIPAYFSKDSAIDVVNQLVDNYAIPANIEFVDDPGFYNVFNVYVFFNIAADEAEFILKASNGVEVEIK
jgi:hypothetical protein